MSRARISPVSRFWGYVLLDRDCWEWTGGMSASGYGVFWDGEKRTSPHRWAYQYFVGPIPDGYHVDHLCRNPRCANPLHLEPVPVRVNVVDRSRGLPADNAAKTHCGQGHALVGTNLIPSALANGHRSCRECRRIRKRLNWHRKYPEAKTRGRRSDCHP